MAKFEQFIDTLKEGTIALAKENFDGFDDEVKRDVDAFIAESKEDLERWTVLLATGDINAQDFRDLVEAKRP